MEGRAFLGLDPFCGISLAEDEEIITIGLMEGPITLHVVNRQLKVNKQLTISKILNFHSKHLCLEEFQCKKPLSGCFDSFSEEKKKEKVPLTDLRAPPQVKRGVEHRIRLLNKCQQQHGG